MEPSGRNRWQPVANGGSAGNGSNKPTGNRWQPTANVSEMVRRGRRFESVRGLEKCGWLAAEGRTNPRYALALGRIVAVLCGPLGLLGSASASGLAGAAAVSSSATQVVVVDITSGGCTTSALSASTAPIEFVIANHTRGVATFTIARRRVFLGRHRSAKTRVRLSSGRYPFGCTPRGRGSLLVVAAANRHRIVVVTGADGRQHLAIG
jgi:hypothetical protein